MQDPENRIDSIAVTQTIKPYMSASKMTEENIVELA